METKSQSSQSPISAESQAIGEGERMRPANNTLEQTVNLRGRLVLAMDGVLGKAQSRQWPATQLVSRRHLWKAVRFCGRSASCYVAHGHLAERFRGLELRRAAQIETRSMEVTTRDINFEPQH
jgi:hypothetical protein